MGTGVCSRLGIKELAPGCLLWVTAAGLTTGAKVRRGSNLQALQAGSFQWIGHCFVLNRSVPTAAVARVQVDASGHHPRVGATLQLKDLDDEEWWVLAVPTSVYLPPSA